jgi:hypothetical protein
MDLMRFNRTRFLAMAAASALSASFAMAQNQTGSQRSDQRQSQQSSQSADRQSSQGQSSQQQNAPEGFILIDERVVALTANEPQNHFLRAHEFLSRGDNRAAAAETRIAAAYLRMQASRGQGGQDQELTQAADSLKRVAQQIQHGSAQQGQQGQSQQGQSGAQSSQQGQSGAQSSAQGQSGSQASQGQSGSQSSQGQSGSQVGQSSQTGGQSSQQGQSTAQAGQSGTQGSQQGQLSSQTIRRGNSPYEQQLTQAFAQANHALAKHFQMQAKRELDKDKAIMAGYDLDAAASSLQAACAWSMQQPAQDVISAVADARVAAMRLLSPNMTADQQTQSSADSQGEAQPAAARISPSDQSQGSQTNASQQQQEKQGAQKALQELDKAIQSTASQFGAGANNSSGNNSSSSGSSGSSGSSSSSSSSSGSQNK